MDSTKKIVVNADDFGISRLINNGVIEAFNGGILKNASILANGDAVPDAITRGKGMSLGIHLSVVFGKPVSNPKKIKSLIFSDDCFARGYNQFVIRYLTGGIKLDELEYEFEAQRQVLKDIEIDHIDSHQHLHLLPGIFDLTARLAERWGVKYVRVPYENFEIETRGHDLISSNVLNLFSWGKKRKLSLAGLKTTDNFFGASFTGKLTEDVWSKLISKLPSGTTEIMCHPGKEDANIRNTYGWTSKWQEERDALVNQDLLKRMKAENLEITSYKELTNAE